LQWKDAPKGYGPRKTLYNRFMRWSRLGVFDRIFAALAGRGPRRNTLRPLRPHLLLGNLYRSSRRLLSQSMCPEPRQVELPAADSLVRVAFMADTKAAGASRRLVA
jgi:hypothetical protein